ncbi:hypothetical protein [Orenia marismortui]|uniref:hypothetical protein n=1 Tax=Orenia marismortui TaxID=46469 RepID=UPI00037D91FD|nr:hypothetical protein [Orenia marismortui]
MQLKNRLVKADFWTDTGLIRKLPAMGRMMYQGLWQLAEDSGVIEADPLAYKMLLFPLDNISIEDIEKWVNVLVEEEKILPYGDGQYYYIKNFHKHQSLRSPAKPNLTLPKWITYVPNNKKRQSGGYIIDYKAMPNSSEHNQIETMGSVSDTVLKDYIDSKESEGNSLDNSKEEVENPKGDRTVSNGQTTDTNKNLNLKENKNLNKKEKKKRKEDDVSDYKKVRDYALKKIIAIDITKTYLIKEDLENHSVDVLKKAVDLAVAQKEENGDWKGGTKKAGVNISSYKYIRCFIPEAKELLEGVSTNGSRGISRDSQENDEEGESWSDRTEREALEIFEQAEQGKGVP